jgi:pimeloyl-ACP methyl ester carboxylesterase
LAPAHLVGHSDGAFVTLYCVCKNPSLVKSLVLGEPAVLPILSSSQVEEDRKMFKLPSRDIQFKGDGIFG